MTSQSSSTNARKVCGCYTSTGSCVLPVGHAPPCLSKLSKAEVDHEPEVTSDPKHGVESSFYSSDEPDPEMVAFRQTPPTVAEVAELIEAHSSGAPDTGKPVDMIDHPPHYTMGKIEPIDVIDDWELDFYLGQVIKYIARYKHKGTPVEDLMKAEWYLERFTTQLSEAQEEDYFND